MSWCLTLVQIMADRGGPRGDRGRGDRGRGRGPRRPRGKKDDEEKWVPCTKLGRLVQQVGHMHGMLSRLQGSCPFMTIYISPDISDDASRHGILMGNHSIV